jgi:formylglycine-generating enzyme required for sulfatase activity
MKLSSIIKRFYAIIMLAILSSCAAKIHSPVQPVNPDDGFPASYTDDYTGAEFVLLPSGSFTMGSPEDEKERDSDEGPAHTVILNSFYISKYETTQAQWEKVMGDNPSKFNGHPDLPVENISWNSVQEFIKKLNKKTGINYRLPTEAEWEYACRAGTKTPFYCGSDNMTLNEYAWFNINSGGETHLVGTRMPNTWGLYDTHGNVSEWIGDGRRGYLSRTENNPKGIHTSAKAIHRGGCWLYPARLCRSANRMTVENDFSSHLIGFRLAINRDAISRKP